MIGDYERPAMSIFDIVLAEKHKNNSYFRKKLKIEIRIYNSLFAEFCIVLNRH